MQGKLWFSKIMLQGYHTTHDTHYVRHNQMCSLFAARLSLTCVEESHLQTKVKFCKPHIVCNKETTAFVIDICICSNVQLDAT